MDSQSKKSFYIISSLSRQESYERLCKNKKFTSEKEATNMAQELVAKRILEGHTPLTFFVLKAVSVVGPIVPQIKATKLK